MDKSQVAAGSYYYGYAGVADNHSAVDTRIVDLVYNAPLLCAFRYCHCSSFYSLYSRFLGGCRGYRQRLVSLPWH